LLFFFPVFLRRAARVANSNTSRTPSLVLAEHSRYLVALMLLETVWAWTLSVRFYCERAPWLGINLAHLLGGHGLLAGLAQLLDGLLVEPQVLLAANQDLGDVGAEVMYFRAPL
jgi:hypothetical protein